MDITEGKPEPLGSTCDDRGVNFSVFSSVAERVEVCLFDNENSEERATLPGRSGPLWHGHIAGIRPGQRYGFRVHGPWDPRRGHLCSPERLLLDPYAKAVDGDVHWDDALFPVNLQNPSAPAGNKDTAAFVPKSVVADPAFDWGDDRSPGTKLEDTVIYEAHVKGYTFRHTRIPPEIRGTYTGLAHPASLEHLTRLGVTAVELLPVHQFIHRRRLTGQGLRNYWGYDPVGYFAPHNEYASDRRPGGPVREFKEMVRALHAAGLEVFLDVVFNHTGEGDARGPVIVFKGFDNRAYYRLSGDDGLCYVDYTGTHNTLNTESPHVRRMILDSLSYWVTEMHVDGFRFDLAPVLARENGAINFQSGLFDALHQDPVLRGVKLIAEPWDLGEGGYQAGRFPAGWSEWNDKYRDEVRGFWNGRPASVEGFARGLAGSPDIYRAVGRTPQASVNFVTCHDGYTLRDLVSYEVKHNEANGEGNRDGHDDNRSWNCGVEGPTDNGEINRLRDRQTRNFLATLLLSQGVPMLLGGDETGRSQRGNNNAYCQDNEVSWFDWSAADRGLVDFTALLIRLRREHAVFHRTDWLIPGDGGSSHPPAITWHDAEGREIPIDRGNGSPPSPLQVFLSGATGDAAGSAEDSGDRVAAARDQRDHENPDEAARGRNGHESRDGGAKPGKPPVGAVDFVVMFNPTKRDATFHLPTSQNDRRWVKVVDTALSDQPKNGEALRTGTPVTLAAHTTVVWRCPA